MIYEAFNARDVEAILPFLAKDVRWPNGWEGGHVHGRSAVRQYWLRQWSAIEPYVTPTAFSRLADGSIEVRVRQIVWDIGGTLLSNGFVTHTYSFEGGLVAEMTIGEADPEAGS